MTDRFVHYEIDNAALITLEELDTALEDVNKIRIALGIGEGKLPKLPQGLVGNPKQCVLANALSNGWVADVSSDILLTHPENFDKPFDWETAVETLNGMGFSTKFAPAGNLQTGCTCSACKESANEEDTIVIEFTREFDKLITEFDNDYLPDLILE